MKYDARKAVVMRCDIGGQAIYSSPFVVRKSRDKERQAVLTQEALALAEQQLRNLYDRYITENPESGLLLIDVKPDGMVDVFVPKERA